jgi:NitT/TauT family transport system substrate-binding protein
MSLHRTGERMPCRIFGGGKEKMKRRITITLVAIVLLLVLSALVVRFLSSRRSPVEKLIIADAGIVGSAPIYVALDRGYFKENGLDIQLQSFPTGKIALDQVLDGKAALATVSDIPIMFEAMKDRKIAILATISSTGKEFAIVARKDRNISKPDDLRGRHIGVVKGMAGEFFLDTFLVINQIPRREIKSIPVGPEQTFDALMSGEVDAVSTWNPYLERLKRELGDRGVIFYGEELYKMTWNVTTMQEFAEKKPVTVLRVLHALLEAEAYIRKHPDESQRITARFLKTDEAVVAKSWNLERFKVDLGMPLLLNLEDSARWAIENGLTERTRVPNFLSLIYMKGLESLKPDGALIVHP